MPFSAEETARFMARRQKPATVNDMLVAGLILAVAEWNQRNGGNVGRTAILMPVNMRPQDCRPEIPSVHLEGSAEGHSADLCEEPGRNGVPFRTSADRQRRP